MPRNVLSIDWDFFTGDCLHDVNECENCSLVGDCYDSIRKNDCRRSLNRIRTLERNTHNVFADEIFSWTKIDIKNANLIVAECHAEIYRFVHRHDTVTNIDAHHDNCFYDGTGIHCGNWAQAIQKDKEAKYSHIGRKTKAWVPPLRYTIIFACLSRPWTPQELDYLFFRMVHQLEMRSCSTPKFVGPWDRSMQKLYLHFKDNGFSKKAAVAVQSEPLTV